MNEDNTLGFKISCEPQIKPLNDNTINIADKIVCGRVKSTNELIVEQIHSIMEDNNITEFYGIDENKVLQLIKEHQALEIIKEKRVWVDALIEMSLKEYNHYCKYVWNMPELTQNEYDLLKEVLL